MEQVGIYARLSVEHGNEKDNSIQNQILLARQWIGRQREQGEEMEEYRCYIDMGYSGTTFERPCFREMLEDARKQRLQCIVCKDYSRLGRDYLRMGEYVEKLFPSWGIRLVCISDGYDSRRGLPGSLEGSMRNLMNEWYVRDIGRRVRQVKQRQKREGCYLGSRPPYGYVIARKNERRVLVEEPRTVEIVRWICRRSRDGDSLEEISRKLWERHVNPPDRYRETGEVFHIGPDVKRWNRATLRRVIDRSSM